jgi:hypothetical protein
MFHRSAVVPLAHNMVLNKDTMEKELTEESKLRLRKSAEIFKKHGIDFLVTNSRICQLIDPDGPALPEPRNYISDPPIWYASKEYAIELGVPEDHICAETYSLDTTGAAYFTKKTVLEPRGIRSVVIVTSDYHMPRTMRIFRTMLGPEYIVEGVNVDISIKDDLSIKAHEENSLKNFLNDFGTMSPGFSKAIEGKLYESHPFYSKIPKKERLRFY